MPSTLPMFARVRDGFAARNQLGQHEKLRQLLESLEQHLDLELSPQADARYFEQQHRWLDDVLSALEQLALELQDHFADEANTGMFGDSPLYGPYLELTQKLAAEHPLILAELTATTEAVRQVQKDQTSLPARLRHLFALIRRHETEENRIIQEVYEEREET